MKKVKMPAAKYHAVKALSSSGISTLLTATASKFKLKFIDGYEEKKQCYLIGTALHSLLLEPDNFNNEYVVTELDARTKAYKELAAQNTDKKIIKKTDYETIRQMQTSVMRNETASRLLNLDGETEVSFFWKDKETDVKCKARIDKIISDFKGKTVIVDVKTTTDASPSNFEKSMINFGYHRQAAWYSHAIANHEHKSPALYIIIACEKTPPYDVACYIINKKVMKVGWDECRKAVAIYKKCLNTKSWPGYPDGLIELQIPKWYEKA